MMLRKRNRAQMKTLFAYLICEHKVAGAKSLVSVHVL
jgi:hypothetical protein